MPMPPCTPLLLALALGTSLTAQAPPEWNRQHPLGHDQAPPDPWSGATSPWFGGGLWSADKHGPPATLVDSVGMGNGLTGSGFHLETGVRMEELDLAAEVLGVKDPAGAAHLTLYRGHATLGHEGDDSWMAGLEMEPLVWGYGLNGGYLLGDAARPFPRLRIASPMAPRSPFNIPLGTWGFQVFVGRLEHHRQLSASIQNPLTQGTIIAAGDDPQAPLLSGYRIQATFSDYMEFYANYINMWGGSRNGQSMLAGYGASDYLTAMFGLKDVLAQKNIDNNAVFNGTVQYANLARSSSNADVGFRIRSRPIERWLGAETVYAYFSRGSKSMDWSVGLLTRHPATYIWKDIDKEYTYFTEGRISRIYNEVGRYTSPNLSSPNDTLGFLLAWHRVRLGLEYLDAVNNPQASSVRPFENSAYPTGFYTYGDPLGNAIGGEARTATLRLEVEVSRSLTGTTILHRGESPFRDDPALWQAAYGNATPVADHFTGLQQTLSWRMSPATALEAGASWERHSAVANVPGDTRNGFQWYTDLTFQFPAPKDRSPR